MITQWYSIILIVTVMITQLPMDLAKDITYKFQSLAIASSWISKVYVIPGF